MTSFIKSLLLACTSITLFLNTSCKQNQSEISDEQYHIRIYDKNPFYWEYKGKPVLLLGGSSMDNLFNYPDIADELDLIQSVGGNYVRNTMSSRKPENPWPHFKLENGLYDLDQWNEEYWDRFDTFLQLCYERDIIVQIEIWDPHDYFKTQALRPWGPTPGLRGWESCPFNPDLNINYTEEESGLDSDIDYYPTRLPSGHPFFYSIPELKDLPVARKYQEAFVDKMLSISFNYPNVLYCMNNETGEPPEWGEYWAKYIRKKAREEDKDVYLADMRRWVNLYAEEHTRILHDRVHFDFFEISQNTQNSGQSHYDQIMYIRDQIVDYPKPLNNIKIYGGRNVLKGEEDGINESTKRFWRNIFGGIASSRFHREGTTYEAVKEEPLAHGIGITELAQLHIRSMRMYTDEMNIFSCAPSNHLLSNREHNEAYCLAEEGKQYALYFPDGGEVVIDLSGSATNMNIRWLDILNSEWLESQELKGNREVRISAPGTGQWAALILP